MRLSERRYGDQRVLLGGAVDHFVAGFQGHPRPGLGVPGSPRVAIRIPPKTTKTPVASDSMVYSVCCFSVMGQPSNFGGTLRQCCCETSDPILLTTHRPALPQHRQCQ